MAEQRQTHANTDSQSGPAATASGADFTVVPSQNGSWSVRLVCQLVGAPSDAVAVPSVN